MTALAQRLGIMTHQDSTPGLPRTRQRRQAVPDRPAGADPARAVVAWYTFDGFCVLAVCSLADRGPFAPATGWLRPALGGATPSGGFVPGFASLVLSFVLLGRVARLVGWPMLMAAQDTLRRRLWRLGPQRRGGAR